LEIYFIFARIFASFCKFQKLSQKERAKESEESAKKRGKFVLNIDFIIALKPYGLCVYETTKQDSI
jgi:hypothetical protein